MQSPLGGNRSVLNVATALLAEGEAFALAIVVSTQGSTYRKAGALALVADNGTTCGVLSGGCLEPALHTVAKQVLNHNTPQIWLVDTQSRDDLIFGSGSGCRGVMQVLVIPVLPHSPHTLYVALAAAQQSQRSLTIALGIQPPWCACGAAWTDEQTWQVGNAVTGIESLQHAGSGEYTLLQGKEHANVVVCEIHAAPRILLIGAGPEATPLMYIARSLGWLVTLIDHRAASLSAYATAADRSLLARPAAALAQLSAEHFSAALIMSHTAAIDLEALQTLALRKESYVGLLGPPARRDELLNQLSDSERDALKPRLHAPLGLRLGGDGPESVALSIVAELQRFLTQP